MDTNIKGLEAIEKLTADKLAEAAKQEQELREAISNAEARLAEVNEQAQQAYREADTKAYHKAQDETRALTDSISMYKDKLERIKREPLMTQAEFEKATATVMADLADLTDAAERHICDAVDTLDAEIDTVRDAVTRGNEVIKTMQLQVLKDERAIKYESGFIIKFNNYSPIHFCNWVKESGLYKRIRERN